MSLSAVRRPAARRVRPADARRHRRRVAAAVAACLAFLLAPQPSVGAAAPPAAPPAGEPGGEQSAADRAHGDLTLRLVGSRPDLSWTRAVALRCPAGDDVGHHPDAVSACAEIDAARGDLDLLEEGREGVPCTREYTPVTASAVGGWRGEEVSWEETFANSCALHDATGAVFRF